VNEAVQKCACRDDERVALIYVAVLHRNAGNAAIAIENASLYRSLQRKVEEYERLKEVNRKIVFCTLRNFSPP